MIYNIKSPRFVVLPRKTKKDKVVSLNLNVYRNLHHSLNGQAKLKYTEIMGDSIGKLPKLSPPLEIKYSITANTKRKFDIMNIASVVDKFFCDALIKHGKLEDDNHDCIRRVVVEYAGYKKNYQFVDITITELGE